MTETAEARLKRMLMRSARRGMREMDLVLGPWAEAHLADLSAGDLAGFDRLLDVGDQDLMLWILGTTAPPDWAAPLIGRIARFARDRRGMA